jgi:hypothetical protein
MFRIALGLVFLCLAAANAPAQIPVSAGVKGGVALTDAFQRTSFLIGDFYPYGELVTHFYSPSKDYLVGPFIELRLPFGLGVEADALYRYVHLSSALETTVSAGSNLTPSTLSTLGENSHVWEFPILAKYRFKLPIARPYLDAGPSFRVTNSFASALSNHGFAAGAGVDVKALVLHISPEVRYTRWGSDSSAAAYLPHSNVNQVELLVGIAF